MSGKDIVAGDQRSRLLEALNETLKLFGPDASQALMFHLKRRLPALEQGRITLEELESALSDLLGAGAEVLANAVRQHLAPPSTDGGNETSATG